MLDFCKIGTQKPEWITNHSKDPRITCVRIKNCFSGLPLALFYKEWLVFLTSSMEAAVFSHGLSVVIDTDKYIYIYFFFLKEIDGV